MADDCMDLPPGFRFHPTDEEIITNYLSEKIFDQSFDPRAIGVVDLNKCEPWDLPSKAKMGEKEWYFFCQKDRKYPTGMRTNRATKAGYWKATGKDKEIHKGKGGLVGMKKTLVFYKGRAPRGEKTNWVMHEFRLEGNSYTYKCSKDEWVVSRVFHKSTTAGAKTSPIRESLEMSHCNEQYLLNSPSYFTDSRGLVSIEDGCDMKGISPSMMSMDDHRLDVHKMDTASNHLLNQSMFLSQLPPPNPLPFMSGTADFGYLHREQATRDLPDDSIAANSFNGQCKVEQVMSSSMFSPSQNTGLSTDKSIKISSYHGDPSAGLVGLEDLWEY